MGKHYVDNKQLYQVLLDYKHARLAAEKKKSTPPPIPEYVGECLLQIANRLSYKPNFANYMFREEMVGDGIENCINYLNNFDPEKSTNPFAYFTQIIYYAFLRRIDREKRQLYIKHKTLENHMILDDMSTHHDSASETGAVKVNLETDYMKDFVSNFEEKIDARKKRREEKKKQKGLDKFIDE
jgi:DNA-directed RNA polymerase specialized sigma24 family protein